ncbi:MAG: glycosyltransferase family 2 protein [Clostridia bacterium]|nr:glycosyltransferase family 2 protein [Clostridia bacterium]
MKNPVLYVVIPCYNEQQVLPITAPLFKEEMELLIKKEKISDKSKILFVNDGSKDLTWDIICSLSKQNNIFSGISLSRNRGHQNALLAGLMEAKKHCDITISIDCDGQDDITAMEKMVDAYYEGNDIVYGVRAQRATDTFFKKFTAQSFYKLLRLMGVEVVYNHADYRLVSKRALEAFSDFEEVNLFLRGMFPLVGFKSTNVYYDRIERLAGESHYPLAKMLSLAIEGITSLSIKPIRIISVLGFLIAALSFIGVVWTLIQFFTSKTVSGWPSLMCVVFFVSGIELFALGVVGEYVGKIYLEVKNRPKYIISERTDELSNN